MQRTSFIFLCVVILMVVVGRTTLRAPQQITDRWTRMADANSGHQYHTAVAVEGRIYVVGGNGYGMGPAKFEEFDPETNTWKILPDMPTQRSFLGVAAVQKKIYAMGGLKGSHDAHVTMEAYDLTENTWIKYADLPTDFAVFDYR